MKILISTDEYEYQINGVTNSVVALRDELRKLGHDVRILALSPNNKSFIKNNDYYISSIHVPIYPDARFSFKWNDKLLKKIIEWNPDIVHIQTEFSSRILANKVIKKHNIPYVMTCHGMYEDYIKYFCPIKKIGKVIIKKLSNKFYNSCKTLIVPSKKLKDKEEEYKIKCPIEIIPTGIELDKYQKKISTKEKKQILKKLNLDDCNKYIVTVCRLDVEKNIDEILDYMPDLLEKDKEIKFIIVGDGPYRKNLKNKVKKLKLNDNVIFTGMIKPNEVYKYYQLGNIFVCASTSESQGLTYIEALANRLPMVCKKDECLEDIIDNGINGFIFENKNEFIESIIKILNDKKLEEKMGKISFKKSNNFSKEEFGLKMERLYKKILDENKLLCIKE